MPCPPYTSATLLLKAGVPAPVVQQRLGHRRIENDAGHRYPRLAVDAEGCRSTFGQAFASSTAATLAPEPVPLIRGFYTALKRLDGPNRTIPE
jgi:hypothetical protein